MVKRKLYALLVGMLVFSLLVVPSGGAAEKYTIGIVLKSFSNPFWMMAKTAAETEAVKQGVNVIVVGTTTETDPLAQVAQIEDFVTQGVDPIAVVPSDSSAL